MHAVLFFFVFKTCGIISNQDLILSMTGEDKTENPQTIMHVELVCIFAIVVAQTLTQNVQHRYHSTTFSAQAYNCQCTVIQLPVHSHATASAIIQLPVHLTRSIRL